MTDTVVGMVPAAPAPLAGALFFRGAALRALLSVGIAGLLAACAAPQQPSVWTPVQSVLESRQRHVVVQQWDLSCGAAALATLMNHQHGEAFTEQAVAAAMLRRTDPLSVRIKGGFSLLDMKRFVQHHGNRGYRGRGFMHLSFDQLQGLLPAILPVDLGGYRHFLVLRGAVAGQVLIADPAFGNRLLPQRDFERAWLAGMAFVVSRRDGLAPHGQLGVEANDFVRVPARVVRQALR